MGTGAEALNMDKKGRLEIETAALQKSRSAGRCEWPGSSPAISDYCLRMRPTMAKARARMTEKMQG
jgi:hypothetical protein